RFNKRAMLGAGYAMAASAALTMAVLHGRGARSLIGCGVIFTLSGLFAAAQDTLEGAIPADLAPPAMRGTAYGLLGALNGMGDLIASAMVGTVWTLVSPFAAFITASALMFSGAAVVALKSRAA